MRRKILVIVNATLVTILSATCRGSSAERTDTAAGTSDALTITRRDTPAAAPADTALGIAPPISATDTQSESSIVQPIGCTPATFGRGDTLTLRMGTPHGDMLSIHSPDNRIVHSLVYPTWGKMRRNYSLIPSEEFRKIGAYPVPADVRAIAQVVGRDTTLEPVFIAPGKYMIVMGENLASDYSNRSTYCTVKFVP